jgi:hypothetical protein
MGEEKTEESSHFCHTVDDLDGRESSGCARQRSTTPARYTSLLWPSLVQDSKLLRLAGAFELLLQIGQFLRVQQSIDLLNAPGAQGQADDYG